METQQGIIPQICFPQFQKDWKPNRFGDLTERITIDSTVM